MGLFSLSQTFGCPESYPLVNVDITMERSTIFNVKIHYNWPFSIAMLNYQRVGCLCCRICSICVNLQTCRCPWLVRPSTHHWRHWDTAKKHVEHMFLAQTEGAQFLGTPNSLWIFPRGSQQQGKSMEIPKRESKKSWSWHKKLILKEPADFIQKNDQNMTLARKVEAAMKSNHRGIKETRSKNETAKGHQEMEVFSHCRHCHC